MSQAIPVPPSKGGMNPGRLRHRVREVLRGPAGTAPGDAIVVALSGGIDSTVLLDVFQSLRDELDLTLHAAHLDHGLRQESPDDACLAASQAHQHDIPFISDRVDVATYAANAGLSIEMAARQMRFIFLEDAMRHTGSRRIALGHHADDQAETVLMRLLRGSGSRGLGGMRRLGEGKYLRPLLEFTRADIEAYAKSRCLEFRDDPSNKDLRHLRNRLRHELLPTLAREYNPKISATLSRTGSLLADEDSALDEIAQHAVETTVCERSDVKIVLAARLLVDYHIAVQRRILRTVMQDLLDTSGMDEAIEFAQVEAVWGLLGGASALSGGAASSRVVNLVGELSAQRTGNRLVLKRGTTADVSSKVSLPGRTALPGRGLQLQSTVLPARVFERLRPSIGGATAAFDAASLTGELRLRSHRPGDRLQPLGMAGHKKVSDLLVDSKWPRVERDETLVLTCGEQIAWVAGLCIADGFKVEANTQHMVHVEIGSLGKSITNDS